MYSTKLILGLFGPAIAAGSGWLAAAAGKYGVHLDASGINALAVAGATAGTAIVVKLIHDVEAKDPGLATEAGRVVAEGERLVAGAVKVDPQIKQAAGQVEGEVAGAVAAAFPSNPPTQPPAAA